MGAVSVDIHKKEREWQSLTLSDANVVKYLILYRSKNDMMSGADTNFNIGEAGDIFEFNQELIVMYASLDELIKECNFKQKQRELLELIFEGNKIRDICNMDIGYKSSATYDLFKRIVDKIVGTNNEKWKETMKNYT